MIQAGGESNSMKAEKASASTTRGLGVPAYSCHLLKSPLHPLPIVPAPIPPKGTPIVGADA